MVRLRLRLAGRSSSLLREKVRLQMLRGVSLRSEFESESTRHSALSLRARLRRAKARRAHTRGTLPPPGSGGGPPPVH